MGRCDLAELTEGERDYLVVLRGEAMIGKWKAPFIEALLLAREKKIDELVGLADEKQSP